ncbi:MAG: histidine kinase region domain protein [Phycisphaerales bacterium]|nr:histidine kinase region domain protein [Phycisphaerales bacterium]
MKLLAKFSLIFTIVFGLGLSGAGYVFYQMLQQNAREQVLYQAHLMMDSALATRIYTTDKIKPLLSAHKDGVFHPETVPAFAATEIFDVLRKNYPSYSYKEATLNPTNPRDKAVDWEEDVIRIFRGRAAGDKSPFEGERMTPTGKSVYLASPLRAAKSCLECHSTPDAAPPEMIKLYGPNNGFGWKQDEVIGAQIVSVPVSLAEEMANRAFRQLMISLAVVGVVTLVVLNLVLVVTVVRPVRRFAIAADQISTGQMEVPELPVKGKDEISMLAAAFNRMHRSLAAAMRMLDEK